MKLVFQQDVINVELGHFQMLMLDLMEDLLLVLVLLLWKLEVVVVEVIVIPVK
jgi:hypothetical protein